MTRFIDTPLPSRIVGYPVDVGPAFSTQITAVDSGSEQANKRWRNALRSISIPQGVRDQDTANDLLAHWLIMGGPFQTFPWRDPTDFASIPLQKVNHAPDAPAISRVDCPLGTGDGITTEFQLKKRYTSGASTYDRDIHFPVLTSVLIGVDGVDPSAASPPLVASVSRPGGVVTFNAPPALGADLTAGFLFDLQVRYESDDTYRGIMRTFGVSGFADVPLVEVRYCND